MNLIDLYLTELVGSIASCNQDIQKSDIYFFVTEICMVKLFAGDIAK